MTAQSRLIPPVVLAVTWMTVLVLAQGAGAPAPQTPDPAGQTVAGQSPPTPNGGRQGAPNGGRQGGGGRRGGFTQFTRELAPQDVLVRGKSLYEGNCASCHASDLRGGSGTNLLRSTNALSDQHGDLIGAEVAKHTPAITLVPTDTVAIAEYIHSILATTGGQGSPPGRNPTGIVLNVLVGDAKAGETYFAGACARCHSVTGDLKNIGSKYPDPRALQNAWVAGSGAAFGRGGRGGGGGAGNPATVTMADGSKLEGTLVRKDDFLVILMLTDGTRKSMARNNGIPKVDVKDPNEAHKALVLELDDDANKTMHDVTAYLATIK
jgi:cytochrome c oxidase cbb3-type subunit 3